MISVNGYILAGGKSSRMGTDKGLMVLNGKPIVQSVIDNLHPEVNKVVIVSNNRAYEKFGFEVIEDVIKDIGPAGGIYSVLNHSETDRNFIMSCDMPFITSATIRFIIERSTLSEITLPVHNKKLEPLFGVYSKTCLPKWKELIEKGIIKLQDLANNFKLQKIITDNNELFSELIFSNINTKVDFENSIKKT